MGLCSNESNVNISEWGVVIIIIKLFLSFDFIGEIWSRLVFDRFSPNWTINHGLYKLSRPQDPDISRKMCITRLLQKSRITLFSTMNWIWNHSSWNGEVILEANRWERTITAQHFSLYLSLSFLLYFHVSMTFGPLRLHHSMVGLTVNPVGKLESLGDFCQFFSTANLVATVPALPTLSLKVALFFL